MRVALIIGHTTADGGAVRALDNVQEYQWNLAFARVLMCTNPGMYRIFTRDPKLGYSAQIRDVYKRADDWNADLTIELHFNAAENKSATGTETFSSGSVKSLAYAAKIHAAIVSTLGLADRGVKIRNGKTKGRGYESLISGSAPAILLEPYFGSNARDCQTVDEKVAALAVAITRAIQ